MYISSSLMPRHCHVFPMYMLSNVSNFLFIYSSFCHRIGKRKWLELMREVEESRKILLREVGD